MIQSLQVYCIPLFYILLLFFFISYCSLLTQLLQFLQFRSSLGLLISPYLYNSNCYHQTPYLHRLVRIFQQLVVRYSLGYFYLVFPSSCLIILLFIFLSCLSCVCSSPHARFSSSTPLRLFFNLFLCLSLLFVNLFLNLIIFLFVSYLFIVSSSYFTYLRNLLPNYTDSHQ